MNSALEQDVAEDGSYPRALTRARRQKIKDGLVAVSMANWCLVRPSFDLFYNGERYFHKLTVEWFELLALVCNITAVALIIWVGIRAWRRWRKGWIGSVLELLFLSLFILPVDFVRRDMLDVTDAAVLNFLRRPQVLVCLAIGAALVLWKLRPVSRWAATLAAVTFPVVLLTVGRALLVSLNVVHMNRCSDPAPASMFAASQNRPRVIWIIFDEMDFRLAFEQRPANLALPSFDQFRAESLSVEPAYAPADCTMISMPALITGRRLADTALDGSDLKLTLADTGAQVEWTSMPSVFSEARKMGVNTALVGWYHPYARVLAGSLCDCSWYPFEQFETTRYTNFTGSLWRQIASLAGPIRLRQIYIDLCRGSFLDSLPLVTDPRYGLILLHLPPPHLPGVWLPRKNRFTSFGMGRVTGYFNNLTLADNYLGAFRHGLEDSGLIDRSWIIVSADHSWRASRLLDGRRDYRIPFMIRPPGAGGAYSYNRPINTLVTHDLILAILSGKVADSPGIARFLNTTGKPDMPVGSIPGDKYKD